MNFWVKVFLFLLALVVPAVSIAYATGIYPVAIVGATPITYRTWEKSVVAAERFTFAESQARNDPVDFSPGKSPELKLQIKKGTLTFLIENEILRRSGRRELSDAFEALAKEKVIEAVRSADLSRAAETVYGLSYVDFKELVLMPQARRDEARELLLESQRDFDAWFLAEKKKVNVRLVLLPFIWNGETVE